MKTFLFCVALILAIASKTLAADSLAKLRVVVGTPDLDRNALIEATGQCISEGIAADAEKVLRQGREESTTATHRLALFDAWFWTIRATGQTEAVEKSLLAAASDRSPIAAVEALLGGRGGLDAVQRSLDVVIQHASEPALFEEAVRIAVQNREWQRALSLARRHDEMKPSSLHAQAQLIFGDPAVGWRLANDYLKQDDRDADDLAEVALVGCQLQDWRAASEFLSEAARKHPSHLWLRSLNGIAAEKLGRDALAASEFLAILGNAKMVLPKVPQFSGWMLRIGPTMQQPPGTDDLNAVESWTNSVYQHRMPRSPWESRWERTTPGIQLPSSVADARGFALAHLRKLKSRGAISITAITEVLSKSGLMHLIPFVEDAAPDVAKYPDDLAINAWALSRWDFQSRQDTVVLAQRCADLFAKNYPGLAFLAITQMAGEPRKVNDALQKTAHQLLIRALESSDGSQSWDHRNAVTATKSWSNAKEIQNALITAAKAKLAAWPDDAGVFRRRSAYQKTRHQVLHELLALLNAAERWEDYASVIEDEALHHQIPMHVVEVPQRRLMDQCLDFPNVIVRWPAAVVDLLALNYQGSTLSQVSERAKRWIAHLKDPRLVMIATWLHGDAKAAEAQMEQRLKDPSAGAADWWIAAWMAWNGKAVFADEASEQAATKLASERLAKAASYEVHGEAGRRLDAALLRATLALQSPSTELLASAREAARRMSASAPTSSYEAGDIQKAFSFLGFAEETATAALQPVRPSISETLQYEPGARTPPLRDLVKNGHIDSALDARDEVAMRQLLRSAREGSITSPWASSSVQEVIAKRNLLKPLLDAATPLTDATARERYLAGRLFEWLGEVKHAEQEYSAAIADQPQLHEAQVSLARLTLPKDAEKTLAIMKLLPASAAVEVFSAAWSIESKVKAKLATQWLMGLSQTERSTVDLAEIQRLISMRPVTEFSRLLWVEAAKFPALAPLVAAEMAEDATRRGLPLAEAAVVARSTYEPKPKARLGWWRSSGSRAQPSASIVTEPPPMLIVLWDAWQRNASDELNTLPFMQTEDAKLARALFYCAESEFVTAAKQFMGSDSARTALTGNSFSDPFTEGGTMDFITTVWRIRKLDVSLDELVFTPMQGVEQGEQSTAAMASWLAVRPQIPPFDSASLRQLRNEWVSSDAARRRRLLFATLEPTGYEQGEVRWQRRLVVSTGVKRYASLLRELMKFPGTCRAALDAAEEDGLMEQKTWRSNNFGQMSSISAHTKAEEILAHMDACGFLGSAKTLRTWGIGTDPRDSLFARAADRLHSSETVCQEALAMLKRRGSSFGRDLTLAWHAHERASDEAKRNAVFTDFVRAHRAEFDEIPVERWPEIAPIFRGIVKRTGDAFGQWIHWQRPWTVPESMPELMVLAKAESRHLARMAELVLKLAHWEDMGLTGNEFCETAAHSFIVLSSAEPDKARRLGLHVLEVINLPSKKTGPRDVNTPEDLHLSWIAQAAQSSHAINVLRKIMYESEIVQQMPPARQTKFREVIEQRSKAIAAKNAQ